MIRIEFSFWLKDQNTKSLESKKCRKKGRLSWKKENKSKEITKRHSEEILQLQSNSGKLKILKPIETFQIKSALRHFIKMLLLERKPLREKVKSMA